MKASRSCFACQRIDSPYYSVLAAHLVGPAGRVAAVEPSPDFHQMLTANARANVRAVNAAASDVPGRLVFYLERSTNLGGTTAVRPHTVESSFEADSASLPQLVTEEELAAARLIKIDVEGAEAAAVSGLVPILPWLRGDAELVIEVTPACWPSKGELSTTFSVRCVRISHLPTGQRLQRRQLPSRPASTCAAVRWREPVTAMTDLVLSRTDGEILPPGR